MAWQEKKQDDLTDGQKRAAKFAGIPADRPGLGAEYPKAVYKRDSAGTDRTYLGAPLKVMGAFDVKMDTVNSLEEEEDALAQGWSLSPDLKAAEAKRDALADSHAEIERLKAQLAATGEPRRGPGRPPSAPKEEGLPIA